MIERVGDILWKAMPEGREKYQAYLCSREWSILKQAVHDRSGGECERCHTGSIEAVHHLTYARKYNERLEDLAGWCKACHEFTHGKSEYDPLCAHKAWLAAKREPAIVSEGYENLTVACPYCGAVNVHMEAPKYSDESEDGNQGRVVIPMWGECPHRWNFVLAGHKGTLSVFVRDGESRGE